MLLRAVIALTVAVISLSPGPRVGAAASGGLVTADTSPPPPWLLAQIPDADAKRPTGAPSTAPLADLSGQPRSARAYGATGDGVTDDTAAIQAAIRAVKETGGVIHLPPGTYSVSSLDLTNLTHGVSLVGEGVDTTRLMPNQDGVHVLDLTGSRFVRLVNFQVGAHNQTAVPETAMFLAQVASGVSNALHFENLFVTGKYRLATFYCYGVPSSTAVDCDFYNYLDADVPVVAFTHDNYASASSRFATARMGSTACSDWTWVGCEIHELSRPAGKTKGTALRLDGTAQMRWFGGNVSGAGPQLVLFSDHPKYTLFHGTTLYSENGTPADAIFYNSDVVSGLSVVQCLPQAEVSLFGGAPSAVYDELQFAGKPTANGFSGLLLNCPDGKLANSMLHCDGLPLRIGTVVTSLLLNPGTVTGKVAADALVVGGAR